MTRNLLLGLVLVFGAGILPAAALADRGDRDGRDYDRHEDRRSEHWRGDDRRHDDHDRGSFRFDIGSIFGGPVYEQQPVQVWVGPVYQTVVQRVWVADVTQTVVDRVWVPEHYEWRDVASGDRWHPTVRQQVLVRGYYEDRPRVVVVTPGHYEDRPTQQLVAAGHWETRYQEVPQSRFGLDLEFRR
jgi:hypothetical protein